MLEIVANIALHTLTIYANRLADTESTPLSLRSRAKAEIKRTVSRKEGQIMNDITASIGHITDSEIAAAICYLDPTPTSHTTGESDDTVIVIVVSVLMFVIAALPFISLYLRTS
jgi:hypothetical protein